MIRGNKEERDLRECVDFFRLINDEMKQIHTKDLKREDWRESYQIIRLKNQMKLEESEKRKKNPLLSRDCSSLYGKIEQN